MKYSKIKQMNHLDDGKSYIPDETLVNFIQDWLQLHKKKATLTQAGEDLSEEEEKQILELRRMKVYILDMSSAWRILASVTSSVGKYPFLIKFWAKRGKMRLMTTPRFPAHPTP
jgi:hypothetical protein